MHFSTKITRPLPATNEAMPCCYGKGKKEKKITLRFSVLPKHSFAMSRFPSLPEARRAQFLAVIRGRVEVQPPVLGSFSQAESRQLCLHRGFIHGLIPSLARCLSEAPRYCKRPRSAFAPCPAEGSWGPVQSHINKNIGDLFFLLPSRPICMTIS